MAPSAFHDQVCPAPAGSELAHPIDPLRGGELVDVDVVLAHAEPTGEPGELPAPHEDHRRRAGQVRTLRRRQADGARALHDYRFPVTQGRDVQRSVHHRGSGAPR